MSDMNRLLKHMQLKPIVADSLDFAKFLERLQESPDIAGTAPALILRAVRNRGVVDIEKEPAERRPYLNCCKRCEFQRGKHSTTFAEVRELSTGS